MTNPPNPQAIATELERLAVGLSPEFLAQGHDLQREVQALFVVHRIPGRPFVLDIFHPTGACARTGPCACNFPVGLSLDDATKQRMLNAPTLVASPAAAVASAAAMLGELFELTGPTGAISGDLEIGLTVLGPAGEHLDFHLPPTPCGQVRFDALRRLPPY